MDRRWWDHQDAIAWALITAVIAFVVGPVVVASTACGNDSSVSGPSSRAASPTLTAQQAAYAASLATRSAGATATAIANPSSEPSQPPPPPTTTISLPGYRIARVEDVSHKALDGPLSSYTVEELQALPLDKSVVYRVVVSPDIKHDQVRPLLTQIVTQLTTQDRDIDEMSVLLYSDEALIGDVYDVGHATWAPETGTVTSRIASTNDRQGYRLAIDVPAGLDDYLRQRGSDQLKFGLTEAQRRQVFKDIVAAEDRAHAEADRRYPPVSDSTIRANNESYDALVEQYKADVRHRYGLTDDQLSQIEGEGLAKRWPLD